MPISEATYERVALEDPEGRWELVCGRLRSKPGMTAAHYDAMRRLARRLILRLDEGEYTVATEGPRLWVSSGSYYLPDVCVIPRVFVEQKLREAPQRLEVYEDPMPLVVEVWSPSTGDYDVEEKLREYQRRGDLEIWLIHPYERTLAAWRRRPGGDYEQTVQRAGAVQPVALPGVVIELERLFD
ncbi:MAG TPA: Uma2 family endonuclease [Dehalococcoidia bacterium]|nr:Uma2 family endonuclease [Dehalococcoidia bacterium]